MTATSFSSLPLSAEQQHNLSELGYAAMTPIQTESLPLILAGRDVLAQAQTGSGKTLAFGLGIMQKINPAFFGIQGLVLCPTRELADQVSRELRKLARALGNIKILTLCGGAALRPQIESLSHGAHIVVGTPGRILDLQERGQLELGTVKTLVFDEADRMIDMGFYDDICAITRACPLKRQTLMFSATYPAPILQDCEGFMINPEKVQVESLPSQSQIEQIFYEIDPGQRFAATATLLNHFRPVSTLAFCNTKAQCEALAEDLQQRGIRALVLHGDLEQRDREDVLVQFINQSCSVLVATDVAARGLDIQTLDAVINVDISPNAETHIHRIGRTGRSEAKGLALTLCSPQERFRAERIEKALEAPLDWQDLPQVKDNARSLQPPMKTICLRAGKKDKIRPGDLLGALTKDIGLQASQVGKINIYDFVSFVAIERKVANDTITKLRERTIKGKHLQMRFME
ncbi:MAG: ATP-dependent RNA helicase DbpA [Alcaligenaceae bacterium]|nr:ATP-dependent RNA helicase DbpA [Alcaligenaceae bacterium]